MKTIAPHQAWNQQVNTAGKKMLWMIIAFDLKNRRVKQM